VGLVVVGDDSSSSSESCDCNNVEEEITTVTAVCVEEEKVCSQKTFTAKVEANFNVELAWTETECHEKVKAQLVEINQAMVAFTSDLKRIEVEASSDNLEE